MFALGGNAGGIIGLLNRWFELEQSCRGKSDDEVERIADEI
jgi:hypothetical protein